MHTRKYLYIIITSLLTLIPFVSSLIAAQTAMAQAAIRITIDHTNSIFFPEVESHVSVFDDHGLPVKGLNADNFTVSENSLHIPDLLVTPIYEHPLEFAVVLDLSSSMAYGDSPTPLDDTVQAAKQFIASLGSDDRVAVVTFADQVRVAGQLSLDRDQTTAVLDSLEAQGNTALHDGILQGIDLLASSTKRPVLVLVTDGVDSGISNAGMARVVDEAVRNQVVIFPIAWGGANQADLKNLADLTQGQSQYISSTYPSSNSVEAAFRLIPNVLSDLRLQYRLNFISSFPSDGSERRYSVLVEHLGSSAEAVSTLTTTLQEVSIHLPGLTPGQEAGGLVVFAPEILAPHEVDSLEILLDGAVLTKLSNPPFEYTWDSTTVLPGEHQITLVAQDTAGNSGSLDLNLVLIDPVQVNITTPQGGTIVSGSISIEAQVDSLVKIAKVEFWVDDKLIETLVDPPYAVNWNALDADLGGHEATVIAVDLNGFQGEDSTRFLTEAATTGDFSVGVIVAIILAGVIVAVSVGLRARRRRQRSPAASVVVSDVVPPSSPAAPPAKIQISDHGIPLSGGEHIQSVSEAVLIEAQGLNPGQTWQLSTTYEVYLGRKRAENDIPLLGRTASRRHAIIQFQNGAFVIINVKAEIPALVNQIAVDRQQALRHGDTIQAGESVFRFEVRG